MNKVILLALLVLLAVSPAYALSPTHVWSLDVRDHTANTSQMCTAVATDEWGNVYITGGFTGTINLGGGDLVAASPIPGVPADKNDVYLAKYNASGTLQWSRRFGDIDGQTAYAIAVDDVGDVLVAGGFAGSVDFGGGSLPSHGSSDFFLAKFSAAGVHQWSKVFGDINKNWPDPYFTPVLAVHGTDVHLAGSFQYTIDFGGGTLTSLTQSGLYTPDVFLAKFDGNGVHQWSAAYGGRSYDAAHAIAVDGSGNVYIAGQYWYAAAFGGSVFFPQPPGNHANVFLAKYTSAGAHQWSSTYGASLSTEVASGLALDASGNVYLAGTFGGTINFGLGTLTSTGADDGFVAKFNSSGVALWNKQITGSDVQKGKGVCTDEAGNVYVGVWTRGLTNLGGASVNARVPDIALAMYDTDGNHLYSRAFATGGVQAQGTWPAVSIATDRFGSAYLACDFNGTMDFGGGQLGNPSTTGLDGFLVKFHETTTDVAHGPMAPGKLSCFPNPFNPATTIEYNVPNDGNVTLEVFDVRGALVVRLFAGHRNAGVYTQAWSGTDAEGQPVGSGVYLARLTHESSIHMIKMVLVK